jgi:hypothetical protein
VVLTLDDKSRTLQLPGHLGAQVGEVVIRRDGEVADHVLDLVAAVPVLLASQPRPDMSRYTAILSSVCLIVPLLTLRESDKAALDLAARFDALLRYVSLRLGRRLVTDVSPAHWRRETLGSGGSSMDLCSAVG